MERIYITGPVKNRGIDQLEEFVDVSYKLNRMGFEHVATAIDALPDGNLRFLPEAEAHYLTTRENERSKANILLYLPGWESDIDSKREVNRARYEGKQRVMSCEAFIELEEKAQLKSL